jgi:hypothetical protein
MGPFVGGANRRDSKSQNCWQVAAPSDSPGGCPMGSAACQQFVRPERHAKRDAEGIPRIGHSPLRREPLFPWQERRDSKSLICFQPDSGRQPSPGGRQIPCADCGLSSPPCITIEWQQPQRTWFLNSSVLGRLDFEAECSALLAPIHGEPPPGSEACP